MTLIMKLVIPSGARNPGWINLLRESPGCASASPCSLRSSVCALCVEPFSFLRNECFCETLPLLTFIDAKQRFSNRVADYLRYRPATAPLSFRACLGRQAQRGIPA